jgi:hypothetical protein
MRITYTLFILFFLQSVASTQTINVSGVCITGTITLNPVSDVNGRPAWQGTGTVDGNAGVIASVYWLTPDNLWVLDFDGQPFFQNACNSTAPNATGNTGCPWTAVTGTSCTGGTALSMTGSGVLPVRFVSFTATQAGKQVMLNWKTAVEVNNKGFEVQRSSSDVQWATIGFVEGAINASGERSYWFTDGSPSAGVNFYRLIQHDLDGHRSFSEVARVDLAGIPFYQLSTNDGNGRYRLTIRWPEPVEFFLLDASGKKLLSKIAEPGIHHVDISSYASGMYLLYLRKGAETVTEKLVKR